MTSDNEKRQLELDLLATDLKLRRKQEFWETPRNIAILVGVAMALAAVLGFWMGSRMPPAPVLRPVGISDSMSAGQFIDAVQTAGILVIASMMVYVVVRLDRTLTAAAEKLKGALGAQQALQASVERVWRRVELIEQTSTSTAEPKAMLDEIRSRLDRLENKDEIR